MLPGNSKMPVICYCHQHSGFLVDIKQIITISRLVDIIVNSVLAIRESVFFPKHTKLALLA